MSDFLSVITPNTNLTVADHAKRLVLALVLTSLLVIFEENITSVIVYQRWL